MDELAANEELGVRFVAAMTGGDKEALQDIFDENAVIWHPTDMKEKNAHASFDGLTTFFRERSISYQDIRRSAFPGGFVQQHVVTAPKDNGEVFQMPVCIVAAVKGGRIVRIDEYYDSARRAQL